MRDFFAPNFAHLFGTIHTTFSVIAPGAFPGETKMW